MAKTARSDALYCRAMTLSGIGAFLERNGLSSERLLRDLDIDPAVLEQSDAFLSWNAVCTLFERAAQAPGLERFGLLWSAALPPDSRQIGPLLHLASLSETGRDYVHLAARYQLTHKNGLVHTVHEDAASGTVAWRTTPHPKSVPCPQMIEYSLSNSYRQVGQFLTTAGVKAVYFTHPAPPDRAAYTAYFDCDIHFGAAHNQLVTDRRYLDHDLRAVSPMLRSAVTAYLDGRTREVPGATRSMARTLEVALPALFGVNRTDMGSVAALYGLSAKKLQRLLRDEGTHYADVRDAVRRRLAERLLTTTRIPIARLAIFLDYASSSAFHQACKRWFGLSPRAMRKGGRPE